MTVDTVFDIGSIWHQSDADQRGERIEQDTRGQASHTWFPDTGAVSENRAQSDLGRRSRGDRT
jgi:hypothetical protein